MIDRWNQTIKTWITACDISKICRLTTQNVDRIVWVFIAMFYAIYDHRTQILQNFFFFQTGWVSFNKSGTQHEHGKCGIYFLVLFCTPVRCNNNVSVHLAVLLYIEIYWTCFNVYLKCLNVCCKDLSDKIQV